MKKRSTQINEYRRLIKNLEKNIEAEKKRIKNFRANIADIFEPGDKVQIVLKNHLHHLDIGIIKKVKTTTCAVNFENDKNIILATDHLLLLED